MEVKIRSPKQQDYDRFSNIMDQVQLLHVGWRPDVYKPATPYIVKSFFLENQGFFSVSSINISEEGAIGMDISLYLVRK